MVGVNRNFVKFDTFDVTQVSFQAGIDRNSKPTIAMTYGPGRSEIAMISAAAMTLWPRCSGDGNFGTMWGPADVSKAKFTLDLTDTQINGMANDQFTVFSTVIEALDDALLDFVTEHQLKILGRKNLSRDEVKMLQIRSIRPKYDKLTGALTGHNMNLSASKFAWDGIGGKYERKITVCDCNGATVPHGAVSPGDVVSATIYANQVYNGVGGDKFGIHWGFQDVAVVCQRSALEHKTEVAAFQDMDWPMAQPYTTNEQVSEINKCNGTAFATDQFATEASGIPV